MSAPLERNGSAGGCRAAPATRPNACQLRHKARVNAAAVMSVNDLGELLVKAAHAGDPSEAARLLDAGAPGNWQHPKASRSVARRARSWPTLRPVRSPPEKRSGKQLTSRRRTGGRH